jgi:hypothetical protein
MTQPPFLPCSLFPPLHPSRPVHPNQRLSHGRGRKNIARREEVGRLLGEVDEQTGRLLTLAKIGEMVGLSRERVRQLAGEKRKGQLAGQSASERKENSPA